jgi:8-oxo-dGTP pyrophosphatase MutT (NUDIX family)
MVTIREAATVMLLRDAPQLQVFMLRRNPRIVFAPGASVFPGGAVDPADRDPELLARCRGLDDGSASRLLGLTEGGLGFWVAAIREAFEEAGVLLAHSAAVDELDESRQALARGDLTFLEFVVAQDLLLDVGALHLFAHWITPAGAPRRYDTWFFAAAAPDGHTYRHDDDEIVASEWMSPADVLQQGELGEIDLFFPTQRSLVLVAGFRTAAAFLRAVSDAENSADGALLSDRNGAQLRLDAEAVA